MTKMYSIADAREFICEKCKRKFKKPKYIEYPTWFVGGAPDLSYYDRYECPHCGSTHISIYRLRKGVT